MNNPELRPETPSIDDLAHNPSKVTNEILDALKSGNLDPQFVEQHLAPLLTEARNVNAVNAEASQNQRKEAIDTVQQNLFVKLAMTPGGKETLFSTLRTFCEDNNLDLCPKPNWNVMSYSEKDLNADWYSKDGKFALKISDDMIFVFKKYGNQWIGESEKYE